MLEQKLVVISLLADKNRKDLSNKEDQAESYRYDITEELQEYFKEGWQLGRLLISSQGSCWM
jgi:hypothetical protein